MNYGKEFEKYAMSDHNVSSLNMHYHKQQLENSMTPYILEEREMRVTQMDIFSRLMADRLLWVAGPVNDQMSTIVQAQLMFLSNTSKEDITMHVDSPGGSVKSGLSMVDVMDYIPCDIKTVNTGMAASMGSVLLGAGTKGKRSSLRHSTTMLHQSSGGFSGNIQDAKVDWAEWQKVNEELFVLLASYCGKTAEQVKNDATRDFWLNAVEAKKYGIIDEIIKPQTK
jgi:ATP-dependent Clp protease protease subunit|tara:strand:- start:2998 stop:3672 length:675 start_codon:yes stop_codon:yes gene_type:complete